MKKQYTKFIFSIITIISIISIFSLMGCSSTTTAAPTTVTVTDITGHSLTVSSPVKNIISLYGPGYEKLVMLGAEDKIAACGDYNKTHAAWAHVIYKRLDSVPSIGTPSTPNVETLLNYDPGVVFWFSNDQNVKAMENAGIPVMCSSGSTNTSIQSLKDLLMAYAQVLGTDAVKKAKDYNTYFDEIYNRVTAITSAIPEDQKPKVYVSSGVPLKTRGGNSVMADTVDKAGGNFVSKGLTGTNTINYEQMMEWNPDIIIIEHAPDLPDPGPTSSNTPTSSTIYDQIMSDPQLQAVNAVKNHQVYMSPTGAFFWDAGQQGILQLEWMAQIFYPDKFKSLNMSSELKEFYSKFFNYKLTDEEATLILEHKLPPGAEKWGYK